MYRTFFVLPLLLAVASTAGAIEKKNFIDDLTSGFGDATSDIGSVFNDATSGAASVFTDVTSGAASVFTQVTSVGGSAVTVVSSIGGSVFTLATSEVSAAGALQPWAPSLPLLSSIAAVAGGLVGGALIAL